MTPLAIVEYIVDELSGTAYEPWANFLLFCLLLAAALGAVRLMLGKTSLDAIRKVGSQAQALVDKHSTYSPEWERVRVRVEPYISLFSNLFFAFCGILSTLLALALLVLTYGKVPLSLVVLGAVWIAISVVLTRFALAAASWAYHRLRNFRASSSLP